MRASLRGQRSNAAGWFRPGELRKQRAKCAVRGPQLVQGPRQLADPKLGAADGAEDAPQPADLVALTADDERVPWLLAEQLDPARVDHGPHSAKESALRQRDGQPAFGDVVARADPAGPDRLPDPFLG